MQSVSDELFMVERFDTDPELADIIEATACKASFRSTRSGVRPPKHIRTAEGMKPDLLPEIIGSQSFCFFAYSDELTTSLQIFHSMCVSID